MSKRILDFDAFSLDSDQTEVCNHLTGVKIADQKRNMLEESSRIVRKPVQDILKLNIIEYSGLVLPGGFGVAKNLCDFAYKGKDFTVNEHIERYIRNFHAAHLPIAACCISPIILAKIFGRKQSHNDTGSGICITLGRSDTDEWPHKATIEIAKKFGNELEEKDSTECCLDKTHRIVTSPAYMKSSASPNEVFTGIDHMIDLFHKLMH